MEKKILLVEPPFYRLYRATYSLDFYPLALGYLSGVIKKRTGWAVMAYNADFTPNSTEKNTVYDTGVGFHKYLDNLKNADSEIWGEVKKVITDFNPDVVGVSSKSQNFKSSCIVAKIAKEINKDIIVIIGGAHASMAGKDVFISPDIDISVRGEGEDTITELLDVISKNGKLDQVKGIIYRTKDKIVENPPREYIKDLDSLPFPIESAEGSLKDYKKYPKEAFKTIFSARGCPHNCIFCGSRNIWSQHVRFRSPENVVKEIKLCQSMGINVVSFEDDYFGVTKKQAYDLCNAIIKGCPGLKWSCELHVKLVDDQMIKIMKESGCFSIRLGIESGNNQMLKKIRKNITIEEALNACRIIKKHGLELHVFYMIGFPEETEETLKDTFLAMKKTPCDSLIYSIFTPYPGTEAFKSCKEKGIIGDDYDVALYNHQSPLNYFCPAIPKEKFRAIAGEIERMVDKRKKFSKIKRLLSFRSVFIRVKELGIKRSFRKGIQAIFGR